MRWREMVTLTDIEHEEYLRKGCKFAGRCPKVMEICKDVVPENIDIGGVQVKCHLYSSDSQGALMKNLLLSDLLSILKQDDLSTNF